MGGQTLVPGASLIHSCSTICRHCSFRGGGGGGDGVLPSAVGGEAGADDVMATTEEW